MRRISAHLLALSALVLTAGLYPVWGEVEDEPVKLDACAGASAEAKLGVSRVVEIDTTGGANIGGSHAGNQNFLNDGEVVLTFDDGPIKSHTETVLKALADQCTKATFFMVGRMALAYPDLVKEVAAGGHTIGSHTWSHKNLRQISADRGKQEIESAISAISKAKGSPIAPFFRFPYLASGKGAAAYLKSRDIAAVWIDIDSKDYRTHDGQTVFKRVLAQLEKQRKGIILMHDIQRSTSAMIAEFLDELHKRGFKVVHMVPKAPVQTIATFDEAADKALAAKAAQKSADPMAERSLVWTMAPMPNARGSSHGRKTSAKAGPLKSVDQPAATQPIRLKKSLLPTNNDQTFNFLN